MALKSLALLNSTEVKRQETLQTMMNRNKELEYATVKYEHSNHWTAGREDQIFLGELQITQAHTLGIIIGSII